ncbi:amidohydrolase [Dietzia sp.]|uniref:amidohydrolase n=1 Tax=Dietzia sp. TaxID=1871616 RepID=UPI002FDB5F8D
MGAEAEAATADPKAILADLASTRSEREDLYVWFHQHPELGLAEHETSTRIAETLSGYGVEPKKVGETGVVAIISSGDGPVVAARADIDALPVEENSGKDYASTATVENSDGSRTPVAHACGHDVHITSLLGSVQALATHTDDWSGTFVAVFQPAEETAAGAQALVDAGISDVIPTPEVYLGQHVLSTLPTGHVGTQVGPVFSTSQRIGVTVYGHGTHGAMPNLGVDPVVLAASIVLRLQTIVSREIDPADQASITVGAINAGTRANIIPDSARLLIDTRAYSEEVQKQIAEAIERIVRAECEASRSPREPEFEYYEHYPITSNAEAETDRVRAAFDAYFGEKSGDLGRLPASEDFSIVSDALGVPYSYWGIGAFSDPDAAVGNHDPAFAPDMQPTLDTGTEALVTAACAWLRP